MNLPLAAGGGDYLFLVVMLVFGLINWLAQKVKEGKAAPPPPRPVVRPAAPGAAPEDERMRRFLEALGVPSDAPEAPTPSFPVHPAPRPEPVTHRAAPPPLPPREHSLDADETTSEPVERIHLPELQTAAVPEFQTVSSRVSADPDGDFATLTSAVSAIPTVDRLADLAPPRRDGVADTGSILAKLRTRADVRTALILSEILGPPRSLRV